jgi:membrane protease YdiL (CAAX protease family)
MSVSQWIALLRQAVAPVLALGAALLVDRMCAARGFLPPGFARPWRRGLALLVLAGFFWVGFFAGLASLGREAPLDLTHLDWPRLFLLHGLMIASLLIWFLAGYAVPAAPVPGMVPAAEPSAESPTAPPVPLRRPSFGRVVAAQLGWRTPNLPRELGLGVLVGVGSWFAVIFALLLIALVLYLVGGEKVMPQKPPELVLWIAGLPAGVRLLAALSAGAVEETFFRGFLQPRIGLWLSTLLFVLPHAVYGQPLLLVGVAILSVIYGALVRWRQNIWPAMVAHALFDGVQLLVVIPIALKLIG